MKIIDKYIETFNLKVSEEKEIIKNKCVTQRGYKGDCYGSGTKYRPLYKCKQCWEKEYVESSKK